MAQRGGAFKRLSRDDLRRIADNNQQRKEEAMSAVGAEVIDKAKNLVLENAIDANLEDAIGTLRHLASDLGCLRKDQGQPQEETCAESSLARTLQTAPVNIGHAADEIRDLCIQIREGLI